MCGLLKGGERCVVTVVSINYILLVFRNLLHKANKKLSQVLVDVLKTTAAAEETIGLHMQSLHDASQRGQQVSPSHSTTQRTEQRVNTVPVRPSAAGK